MLPVAQLTIFSPSDKKIAELAREKNLKIAAVSDHYIGNQSRSGLVLGYTAFSEKQVKNGLKELRKILISQTNRQAG